MDSVPPQTFLTHTKDTVYVVDNLVRGQTQLAESDSPAAEREIDIGSNRKTHGTTSAQIGTQRKLIYPTVYSRLCSCLAIFTIYLRTFSYEQDFGRFTLYPFSLKFCKSPIHLQIYVLDALVDGPRV